LISVLYSENVAGQKKPLETYSGVHMGGICLDSSIFIRISNCIIETGDYGFVIKPGRDADGLRDNCTIDQAKITDCMVRRKHDADTLGSKNRRVKKHCREQLYL